MFEALMNWMKSRKMLPNISDTERQALEAGTVWIDGDFFCGAPDFQKMLAEPYSRISDEEQAFIDGPLEELLNRIDADQISRSRRIPDEIIQFVKDQGFMGLMIPKQYGGKGFSRLALSTIMARIGPVNGAVGTLVIIPNSLGAAELIIHYGTEQQKDQYLPKLASGEYVPCFGLTEPTAGSDAASIKAEAVAFKDDDGQIKLKLNFRKRYITLAPIANLCTIACQLHDPDHLLGKGEQLGITCVLVHKDTPGFSNGDHHDPVGDPFYNGPLYGENVIVPVENIIGGAEYAGKGWKMLMEQLAGGRAISLPAGAVGSAKYTAMVTGAYSMVRQQFGIPIGRMEGVEEKVAHVAGMSYMLEAARVYACSAIDNGQQPPVVSAVLKAYTTEINQQLAVNGMDIMAGSAVMQGPNNAMSKAYTSAPVSITVEGANILTRTLMIFGQGATRCHPYALKVVEGAEKNDVGLFRSNLLGWMGHFFKGLLRSETHYLTRGYFVKIPEVAPQTKKYYRRLGWAAARFGVITDLAMFAIGGGLKARGKLTGRYSDVLAWMVLGFSALRRFEAEGRRSEDLPLLRYSLEHALSQIHDAFIDIYRNFDGPLGLWMKTIGVFEARINPIGAKPGDRLSHQAALCIQADNAQYRRLGEGVFLPRDESKGFGRLLRAFHLISKAQHAAERITRAQKNKQLSRGLPAEVAEEAQQKGLITAEEVTTLRTALAARLDAIEVDAFSPDDYFVEPRSGSGESAVKVAVNA